MQQWDPKRLGVDLRGWEWYYLHALSHRERFASPSLLGDVWSVDFNSSGTEYANVVNAWGIQVRSAETGEVVRERKLGSARFVDWSPDGKQIAVSGFANNVAICDARTLEVVCSIKSDSNREVFCVHWSPDCTRVATCKEPVEGEAIVVSIWNVLTGELMQTLEGHTTRIREVQWSPDGTRLASAGLTETKIWDTTTWAELATYPEEAWTVSWSPDGTKLASGHKQISIRSVATGNTSVSLKIDTQPGVIFTVCWRPDSSQLACGHFDGTIRSYDANTGQHVRTFYGHTGQVRGIAWSQDGDQIVSGGLCKTVRLWDVDSGDQTQIIPDEATLVVDWSHNGNLLATGATWEDQFSVWDPTTGRGQIVDPSATRVEVVCWSPNDLHVAYGGRDYVRIWNTKSQRIETLDGFQTWIMSLVWSPDGSLLAGNSFDGHLVICSTATGELTLHQPQAKATSVDWNHHDGNQLVVGDGDGLVRLLTPDGSLIWKSRRDSGRIKYVRFSPDGSRLASAQDGAIVIWDADTGQSLAVLDALQEDFNSVDWSPDGTRLISCSDSSVSIWDTASGHVALKLASGSVLRARWNPDGKRIVAGSWGKGAHIWDATRGYLRTRIEN